MRTPIPGVEIMFWSIDFANLETDSSKYNCHFPQQFPQYIQYPSIIPKHHHPLQASSPSSRLKRVARLHDKGFLKLKAEFSGLVPNLLTIMRRHSHPASFKLSFCIYFEATRQGNTLN